MFASIAWSQAHLGHASREECVFAAVSKVRNLDFRFLSAANFRKRFDPAAEFRTLYMPHSSPREVAEAQREQLSHIPPDRIVRLNQEEMKEAIEVNRLVGDNFVARGIWVPMTADEVAEILHRQYEATAG